MFVIVIGDGGGVANILKFMSDRQCKDFVPPLNPLPSIIISPNFFVAKSQLCRHISVAGSSLISSGSYSGHA